MKNTLSITVCLNDADSARECDTPAIEDSATTNDSVTARTLHVTLEWDVESRPRDPSHHLARTDESLVGCAESGQSADGSSPPESRDWRATLAQFPDE